MLEVHQEWPLVNRFPNEDVAAEPTVEEVANHWGEYDIFQDYWKVSALSLGYDKRYASWKSDFDEHGRLAQNFTLHGSFESESCGLVP